MKQNYKLDYDEIISAIKWGGKLGLIPLFFSSLMLVAALLKDESSVELWSKWVRIGIEIFLMGGWSFGAIALVRQVIAERFGHLIAVITSGFVGTLVDNAMAVLFILVAKDAPPSILAALIGMAISFLTAGLLTRNSFR